MRLQLEATPAELDAKGDELIRSLVQQVAPFAPQLAETLEKALPEKKVQLKHPVLREVHERTQEEYKRTLRRMMDAIHKVITRAGRNPSHDLVSKAERWVEFDLQKSELDLLDGDTLEKGAGHKYVRRWRGPDGKYRYEYNVLATATLRHYQVGDKVAVKHKGQLGHLEVMQERTTKEGVRQLYVKHDETGKETWVSEMVLNELFRQTHNVKEEAYRALHKIDAVLSGYDPEQGPGGGVQRAKPLAHWAKTLEARRSALQRLFDPYEKFHSLMDYAAKAELFGWYRDELHDVVEAVQPILQRYQDDQHAAWARQASYQEHDRIEQQFRDDTKAPFEKMIRPLWSLVDSLNFELSRHEEQKSDRKHSDPEVSALMQTAWEAAGKLPDPGKLLVAAFDNLTQVKEPEKWARQAKAKITRYFNLVQEASAATTAATKAQREVRIGTERANPVTEEVSGLGGTKFRLQFKHATEEEKATAGASIRSMELAIDQIKQAGFPSAVKDLTVYMDYRPSKYRTESDTAHGKFFAAGTYHPYETWSPTAEREKAGKGDVTIYSPGFREAYPSSVMVHELGHRFYYRDLTEGEREEWRALVAERSSTPTKEQTDAIWESIKDKFQDPDEPYDVFDRPALMAELAENHGGIGRTLHGLITQQYFSDKTIDRGSVKEYLASIVGHPIVDPFVTFYAGTNESEYFAEAFQYYVQGGPRNLPEWTRALFERLTHTHRLKKAEDEENDLQKAGGPFIGPRGGKWADPQHTIPWEEPGGGAASHNGTFRYGAAMRPVSHSNVPKGAKHEPHDAFRHGQAVYDRPLTTGEIESYELTPILNDRATEERVARVLDSLHEYADEYRELLAEDPKIVETTVRQALDRQGPAHYDVNAAVGRVLAGLAKPPAEATPATPADPKVGDQIPVAMHEAIVGEGGRQANYRVVEVADGKVKVAQHADSDYGPWMPVASLKHFQNDLAGKVDLPPSGNPDIDAVTSGQAKFLGKGDDGMAFRVGDKVVKVSTTVPYQPDNPGHRTPEEAATMLQKQVAIGNELADAGVPGVQRSEFVKHGDKGFQIKPWVSIPPQFSREQLDALQDSVIAMHAQGYALNDEPQAGLDASGQVVMFDVGKAAKNAGDFKDRDSHASEDMERLSFLYRKHNEKFVRRDFSEGERHWEHYQKQSLKWMRDGKHDFAKYNLQQATDKLRSEAQATLKGPALDAALKKIDEQHRDEVEFWGTVATIKPEAAKKGLGDSDLNKALGGGGPFIGPRGGKWADPEHTIHWEDAVPHENIHEEAHSAVKDEVKPAAMRAVAVGADPASLRYVGAGGEGIIFSDKSGKAYRVLRTNDPARREEKVKVEQEAVEALKGTPAEKYMAPHFHADPQQGVIVRAMIEGHPGGWSTKGLREAYEVIKTELARQDFSSPEYKEDSFIVPEAGGPPIMVDIGFLYARGKREARQVIATVERGDPAMIDLLDQPFAIRNLYYDGNMSLDDALRLTVKIKDLKPEWAANEYKNHLDTLKHLAQEKGDIGKGEDLNDGPRSKAAHLKPPTTPKRKPVKSKTAEEKAKARLLQDGYSGNVITPEMDLGNAEKAIQSQKVEHCALFDDKGNMLARILGGKSSAPIQPALAKRIKDSGNVTFTHNHPHGGCFSAEDVMVSVGLNLKEMRAVGVRGTTYVLTRPEKGWLEGLDNRIVKLPHPAGRGNVEAHVWMHTVLAVQAAADNQASRRMDQRLIAAGGKPGDSRHPAFTEEVWDAFCAEENSKALGELFKTWGWGFRAEGAGADLGRSAQSGDQAGREQPAKVPSKEPGAIDRLPFLDQETWDDGTVVRWHQSPFAQASGKPFVASKEIDAAPVGDVPLASLQSTQTRVTANGVGKYLDKPPSETERGDLPVVFKMPDGSHVIQDGHHRLAAAMLRGDKSAKARVVTPASTSVGAKVGQRVVTPASNSVGAKVGQRVVIPGIGSLHAEPTDGDDSFPPAVASYKEIDGWLTYTGKNGSQGVVVGTKDELTKWMAAVGAQKPDAPLQDWNPEHGGADKVKAARQAGQKVADAFGLQHAMQFTTQEGKPTQGEHGKDAHILNAHLDGKERYTGVFEGVEVPQGAHTAAHEMAHAAFAANPGAGREAMQAVGDHEKKHGHITGYHGMAGRHEGLMEAAALYVNAPEEMAKRAPELHAAMQKWFASSKPAGEAFGLTPPPAMPAPKAKLKRTPVKSKPSAEEAPLPGQRSLFDPNKVVQRKPSQLSLFGGSDPVAPGPQKPDPNAPLPGQRPLIKSENPRYKLQRTPVRSPKTLEG